MKVSYEWLNEFVDLSGISVHDFADKLSLGAFEVEEVKAFGPDLVGPLVVGEICQIMPHPNADKIRLTKTRVAEGEEPLEIVCGAGNIEVGQRVPVALPGAKVINRHDGTALQIKQSKIRGVTSNGMLCSSPELGISGSGEGILILDSSVPLGTDIRELLNIKQDWILHVSPRSNRGDALCVQGLAREAAALFKRPLKEQTWVAEFAQMKKTEEGKVSVSVEDGQDCPFFSARAIRGVQVAPSPPQIVRRLEALGLRSVNNVVDVTNYVLQELGQPLHAYDADIVKGAALSTRRARDGESVVTIDGKERSLPQEALVIADGDSVVGVAGVMGGKDSEIGDQSKNLVLEAASFNPARVRRSSRLLGLSSDSSLRFERGVDIASVKYASDRAAYLIAKYCGGTIGGLSTAGNDVVAPREVKMRLAELARIAEINIAPDDVGAMLEPLGFTIKIHADDYNAGVVTVLVPSFRQRDVEREIDVIEELCRIYGYDRIKPSMPDKTMAAPPRDSFLPALRNGLTAAGFSEAWLSSLTGRDDLSARGACAPPSDSHVVSVLNPLSPEHQVMRARLLPGLIKAAVYNQDRGAGAVGLFEVGRVYMKDSAPPPAETPQERHVPAKERTCVAGILTEEPVMGTWKQTSSQDNASNFFYIKGAIENLVTRLAIPISSLEFEACESDDWYHPGRTCAVYARGRKSSSKEATGNGARVKGRAPEREQIGSIGEIHPEVCRAYKLKGRPAAFELNVDVLRRLSRQAQLQEIYATPLVVRDLTADLDGGVSHAKVLDCIRAAADENLRRVDLVSVFALSEGRKSLSYRLTFQDARETLTAEKVDPVLENIRAALSEKLKASFRV
ncbi:MAG: phenylalanine--tRNA ligase subunit beta [Candidatus Obscuribacterales bacterium]|nr:phenylalanine--tRNA ligase subunit beta [Candidatus Obscuribacterales bacterium]